MRGSLGSRVDLAFGMETSRDEVGVNFLIIGTRLKEVVIGVNVVALTFDLI